MPAEDDRRQPATRVVLSDGNGGRWVGYSFTIKRLHTWLAIAASVVGIAATVYGSVQLSVANVVRQEIERQIADERSPFNRQLHSEFDQGCVLGQSEVRQRMREVERELAVLREQNVHMNQELSELRSDVKEILKLVR
jgi:ABC-type phosphate transport system auxiliary subunit